MPGKQRVAHLDLLKGLCIILVMMYHINHEGFNLLIPGSRMVVLLFLVPMFYMVSGINFKRYSGFADFVRHKVNNILVPLLFFIVFAVVVRLFELGARLALGAAPIQVSPVEMLVSPFVERYWPFSAQLWFLFSLFWVNLLFYPLQRLPWWGTVVAVAVLAGIGCWLGYHGLRLPLMFDTALVAMPFFALGWGLNVLMGTSPRRWDRWGIVALLVMLPLAHWCHPQELSIHFMVLPPLWQLYPLAFLLVLALWWAARGVRFSVPVVNYLGRYSLIVFGTHAVIMLPVREVMSRVLVGVDDALLVVLITIVLIVIECGMVWLLKNCCPHLTAQRPFIPYKKANKLA